MFGKFNNELSRTNEKSQENRGKISIKLKEYLIISSL